MAQQPLCDVLLRPAFHCTTQGLTVTFADSSTTYGLASTAVWNFGDGSGVATVPQHVFPSPGSYEVCLTLSAQEPPCSSTFCSTIVVPLNDCGGALDAHFEPSLSGTNAVSFLDLGVSSFAGEYLWQFGDGAISSEPAPSHIWALPGPHFVTLNKTEGDCSANYGRWVNVDGNATTCGPSLFVDFYATNDGGLSVFQPNIVANNVTPVLNIWSFGDGTVDTSAIGMHAYEPYGTYQTCLLVGAWSSVTMDTCFSLVCSTSEIVPAAGLDEQGQDLMRTWPVPFTDMLHIATDDPAEGYHIRVSDPMGRVLLERTATPSATYSLALGDLPAGTYIVELIAPDRRLRTRVVKVH